MWLNGIVTESSPKFTLFWFMNRDVGGVGLNVPSSEPNFLNLSGGLAYFGSELGEGVIEGSGSGSNFLQVELLSF